VSRPDIINQLPNGWTEEITFRKHIRADGSVSRKRKLVDANGVTREVWHDVVSRDGTVLHGPHLKYRHQEPTP
jgi:hypothetical protein